MFRPPPLRILAWRTRPEPLERALRGTLPDALAFYTVDLPYLWGRSCDDGSVLIGSGLVLAPPGELYALDVAGGEPRQRLADLERRVRALHPELRETAVRERWGGPVALLRARPPYLEHHPELPKVVVTGGYSGHGVAASVHFGTRAAAMLP